MKAFGAIELLRLLTLLPLLIILLAMANGVQPRSVTELGYISLDSAESSMPSDSN